MFIFVRYLIVALIFKLSLSTKPTIEGKVVGKLINHQAVPLTNKVVSLASDSLVVRMTRTNNKGEFKFDKLPKGNYRILVVLTGYGKYTTGFFQLTENKPGRDFGDIILQPASSNGTEQPIQL